MKKRTMPKEKKVTPIAMPAEFHIHNHMPDTNEADKALVKLKNRGMKGTYASGS